MHAGKTVETLRDVCGALVSKGFFRAALANTLGHAKELKTKLRSHLFYIIQSQDILERYSANKYHWRHQQHCREMERTLEVTSPSEAVIPVISGDWMD